MSRSSGAGVWDAAIPWITVIAWMAIIFAFSSQPDSDLRNSGRFNIGVYKLAHLVVFGVLGVLVARATQRRSARAGWWAWVIVGLYAIVDEIHQAVVPGRSPLVTDVAIDALGGLLGIATVMLPGNVRDGRVPPWLARLLGTLPSPGHAGTIDAERSAEKPR